MSERPKPNDQLVQQFINRGLSDFTRVMWVIKKQVAEEDLIPLIFGFEVGSGESIDRDATIEAMRQQIMELERNRTIWDDPRRVIQLLHLFDSAHRSYSDMLPFSTPPQAIQIDKMEFTRESHNEEDNEFEIRFVNHALIPFLVREQEVIIPTRSQLAAISWGYQVGADEHLGTFKTGRLLRHYIKRAQKTGGNIAPSIKKPFVEILQKIEMVIPEISWITAYTKSGEQNLL